MLFVLALVAWVGGCAMALFGALKYTVGLRIGDVLEEVRGLTQSAVQLLELTHCKVFQCGPKKRAISSGRSHHGFVHYRYGY